MEHALNFKKGVFVLSRYSEVRRITAEHLREVCINAEEELLLQEITGEVIKRITTKIDKKARLGILARGFWMRGQKVFCNVRVFNPFTKCYRTKVQSP